MKHGISLPLRALAHLLRYPDAAMRNPLPEVRSTLEADPALGKARRAELAALADRLLAGGMHAEAVYVDLFDRGRGTSLYLFEHVHGDSRDRGPAMVDLVKTYEQAGLLLDPSELPDYLPVLLEFASTQPRQEACAFIGEFAHILQAIAQTLRQRDSDYFSVIAAVLELAGVKQLVPAGASAGAVAEEEPLDISWAEPAAFDGCSTQGQAAPNTPQPVHIHRRPPSAEAR
ncbi:Nitrate reductase molybdenum cofactor assembly chaperone NarJ [compost metagenome]